jgi:hypothetical protein
LNPTQDRDSTDILLQHFADGVSDILSIGLKLRTRPTRGVDRVAEAQFRISYEQERENLARWLSDNLVRAASASAYEVTVALTDSSQDASLDPKTRAVLVNLRKELLETLPRVATPDALPDLGEAFRVAHESGAFAPSSLANLAAAVAERMGTWPVESREAGQAMLLETLPLRTTGREKSSGTRSPRATSGETAARPARPESDAGDRSMLMSPGGAASGSPIANGGTHTTGAPTRATGLPGNGTPQLDAAAVTDTLFATGPEASRAWAELVSAMSSPPEPPADRALLERRMSALQPAERVASCKRMRMALPDWCTLCGQAHLEALGSSAPAAETLATVCQRPDTDPAFRQSLREALPVLAQGGVPARGPAGNGAPANALRAGHTEAGLRAVGRIVERLWDEELGDAIGHALAHSSHPRPGTLRRLISEDAPSLTAHLAAGEPVRDAPWTEILNRRGVPWPERLALPLSRIPTDELVRAWAQDVAQDPALGRSLLDVARDEAASRPAAGALLVQLLDRQPELTCVYLAPLVTYLTAHPEALAGKRLLARALWDAVLAQPRYLPQLPEALGAILLPLLPETISPTPEWASAVLRGPEWLRHHLRERQHVDWCEAGAWLQALLAEVGRGALPQVPDAAAATIATLLSDALRPEEWTAPVRAASQAAGRLARLERHVQELGIALELAAEAPEDGEADGRPPASGGCAGALDRLRELTEQLRRELSAEIRTTAPPTR